MRDDAFYNRVSNDRLASRQMDELIGLARGLCADKVLNQAEVEFLQTWLAANLAIHDQPVLTTLWRRISEVLSDGCIDQNENLELFELLQSLGGDAAELGESLKASDLPLCRPFPPIWHEGAAFCFTGTFSFGKRKACEQAAIEHGATCGSLTKKTDFLVIGSYATESWKHSSMGDKILRACDYRDSGIPIKIVSEAHWVATVTA